MLHDAESGLDVADVYAAALFELASEADAVDEVRDELAGLVGLVEREPGFAAFAASAAVDDDDRARSLEAIFRGRLSDRVLNTLLVMNERGRLGLIHALWRAFVLRLETERGQIETLATSAVELNPAERTQVEQLAANLSGAKPLITYRVDPALIGGLVLQVGDQRFDYSVRRHLQAARVQLLERSGRGLKVGVQT
jgi:F-type H+-transporting ATPase subunit delta